MLKITPVRIPGSAAGRTTLVIVSHFVAPRAREASLKWVGIASNDSLVEVIITGRHMIPNVREPDIIETPNPRNITKRAIPKSPYIILGIPARLIIVRFIILVRRLSFAYSTRYIPVNIPNGTDTTIVPIVK